MVGPVDLALNGGALFALAVFVTAALRYELKMGIAISALTGISITSVGLLAALVIQVGLNVPFVWSMAGLGGIVLLFVLLYELVE